MYFSLIVCVLLSTVCISGATTPDPGCYTVTSSPSRSCLEKYQVIDDHVYCQMDPKMEHPTDTEQTEIADVHNKARSSVQPAAADMLDVAYSKGNERPALIWTQLCKDKTFSQYQRFLPGYTFMGLNTLVSTQDLTWTKVVDQWLQENSSFTYGGASNDPKLVSNFTQIIWAQTAVVGCAKNMCPNGEYRYACSYSPGLDVKDINHPYTSAASGPSCSACPTNCTNNLCDCSGILCLNGGVQDLNTCTCTCPTGGSNYYGGLFCELYCKPNGDHPDCGKKYTKASCITDRETAFNCPWLCDICPYAGKNYTRGSVPLPYQRGKPNCASTTTTLPTTGTGNSATSGNANGSGGNNNKQNQGLGNNGSASIHPTFCGILLTVFGLFLAMN